MEDSPSGAPTTEASGWRLVLVFVVQILTGTALFSLIAAIAIGLNIASHYLEAFHIDDIILTILKAVEVAILCVDVALFLFYLAAEATKFVRDTWRTLR